MDSLLQTLIVSITFFLMLIVGLELQLQQLIQQSRQLLAVGGGILAQVLLLPALTLFIIQLTSPPLELSIGMLLVSLCPGGSVSNYYTLLARGDIAYSVTLTTLTTLSCFITLPLLFNLLSADFISAPVPIQLPFWETIWQLFSLLIAPVLLGILIRKLYYSLTLRLLPVAKLTGAIGLLFVVAAIFISKGDYLSDYFAVIAQTSLLFTLGALGSGLLAGYLLRLQPAQIIAIGIEFPARNLAIATSISLTLLELSNAILFAAAMFVLQLPVFILVILSSLGLKRRSL